MYIVIYFSVLYFEDFYKYVIYRLFDLVILFILNVVNVYE